MRIKSLSVRNLRLYGDEEQTIEIAPTKNVTILLGDNGAGKTSLLDGCSVLLSQFAEPFPGCKNRKFTLDDVRSISNQRKADYLHVRMELNIPSDEVAIDMYQSGNAKGETPKSNIKAIKDYALSLKRKVDNNECITLPIIAYYSTERGQIKPVIRRRNFNEIFPRWDIYKKDSFDSATDFKRFFTWFERNEDLERREREERWDRQYRSPVLEAVRRALNIFFDGKYANPKVKMNPLRFVMEDVSDANNLEHRIERMSDGYRITIALVADIASRMAEANPSYEESGLNDPLQAEGIVLIDEIDLHLHPKLQREILRKLTNIFPNVQFIVSTHSPSVVIGALNIAQVVKLEDGIIDSNINTIQYDKYDVSLLLLSNLFDLDNVRTNEFKELEAKIEDLLNKRNLTEEETKTLKELLYQQRTYGYSNGEERR